MASRSSGRLGDKEVAPSPTPAYSSQPTEGARSWAGYLRLRPSPKDGLSRLERAVFLGRWVCLGLIALVAVADDRLQQPGVQAMLVIAFAYLGALEVLARRGGHRVRWAVLVSIPADLLLTTWASAALSTGLAGLYFVVVLNTALSYGAKPTLLASAVAGSLYLLVLLYVESVPGGRVDSAVLLLTLLGTGVLAGNLAELKETERREKIRMTDAERVKSDLVSLVSHELRTPLAMIKGAVDLLLDGSPGPMNREQQTFLTTISDSCERLISLVEDVLARAWVEAGKLELKPKLVDVRMPVRAAVKAFRPLSGKKRQEIHLDYPQVLSRVSADDYWIHQVAINLLSNASKYTTEGGHIYVSVVENQSHILVSVTDDGAGITRAERERIFEPFFRGNQLSVAGTGLGLAIVQYVVEKHGGKVLVDTSLGQGTTVLFTLPKQS